ncbi:hypothetical protein L1049_016499 [Liquidambar formosana]|uniref:NB-ARC domain-containing protein n=1 Tax=Liquidambar formosana TaxID=63359 RepID=A0AAP0X6W1_LIQFO
MQQIDNKLLNETNKFDNLFWVTVSKVLDVIKLQDCIASKFAVSLSQCEDETTRVARLFVELTEKKRYVLILDDLWEAFELKNVGIPEPTSANGCKIVITTRSLDVCRNMECKGIKMELLSEDEAWNLFLDKVGHSVLLTPSLEATMKLVAEECACLPLAIIMIARSMKGVVDEYEWRNALEELRKATGGLTNMEKVLEQLKYSYFCLRDEKFQHCLLYCALYPEDLKSKGRS